MSIQEFQNMCHGSRRTCRILNSTGQLISKGLLQENERINFHLTTMILQVSLFWKNLKTPKDGACFPNFQWWFWLKQSPKYLKTYLWSWLSMFFWDFKTHRFNFPLDKFNLVFEIKRDKAFFILDWEHICSSFIFQI